MVGWIWKRAAIQGVALRVGKDSLALTNSK